MADDLRYADALDLRGESAAGCADRWREYADRRMKERASAMHPDARPGFLERATLLVSGKYENLKRHERREVRAGKLERLQKDNAEDANREAFDVLKQSEGVDRAYAADLARIKATRAELGKDEAWEKGEAEKLAKGRAVDFSNLVMQIGATSLDGGDRIAGAVAEGLIDEETGKAMERAHRRGVVATTLKTLLKGGKADQAEGFLGVLEADDAKVALDLGFTPDALEKVRGGIAAVRARRSAEEIRAKEEDELARLRGITDMAAEARADGSVAALEDAIGRLHAVPAEKGSRVARLAAVVVRRLENDADAAADRDCWDAIVEHGADGSKWEPPKGTRMARRYKALKESYDRQVAAYMAEGMLAADAAAQAARSDEESALRAGMLAAASVNPGEFSSVLAEKAEKGEISLDQYRRLRDEFRDTWMKEGMPKKAKALVDILKREFYAGKDYDLSDRLAADSKTGRFGYLKNPDTKKPFEGEDAEYEAQVFVPYDPNSWGGIKDFLAPGSRGAHYKTETRKLTSDEQLELLNIALDLAKHDGDETHIDPLTGETLSTPRVLNAADEFQRACTMLRKMKQAESAADRIQRFAEAQAEVESGFGRFERGKVAAAEKREAQEDFTRQALKAAKRKPFAPKMPGASGGSEEAGNGGQETED